DELLFRRSNFQFTGPPYQGGPVAMQISLGYAAHDSTTASAHFDDNIGAHFMKVFDGSVNLSSSGTGSPLPFDVVIDVANTFNYDPALGDLLVDIRVLNPAFTFQFGAAFDPGATTRIWNTALDQPDGIVDYGFGLATRFQFASDQVDHYSFQ